MLTLGKNVHYALISFAYMAAREGRFVSAREIAEASDLPLQALMLVLKHLHGCEILRSTRGVKGGYQIASNVQNLTLFELSELLEDPDAAKTPTEVDNALCAVRGKLTEFMKCVRVRELIEPGKGIHVPLQDLRILERTTKAVEIVSA